MITPEALKERFIPFRSLKYSTEAFIDYCIPECQPKFNYAMVGPGVSQNPNQPVSLREPHGFQIGGVSLPHGKVNPAHMHFTCEVFICTKGTWRIQWGFNPEVLEATIGEGDIVSVPTWLYRGFTNDGVDDGFLFTVLGGDHTGGILWGPTTIAAAARNGVYLTDDYRMIDTRRGQSLGPNDRLLQAMSNEEIATLRHWSLEEMSRRIVRFQDLVWSHDGLLDSCLPGCGAQLAPVLGLGVSQDRNTLAPVSNAHGASVEWLRIPPGGRVSRHQFAEKQVLIAKQGTLNLQVETNAGPVDYAIAGGTQGWDTFSLPAQCWRTLSNPGGSDALALLVSAGDHRKRPQWDPSVVAAAAAAGYALDANGHVGARRFVERAQT